MDQAVSKAGQPVKRGTMAHDHDVAMLLAESAVQRRDRANLERCATRLEELARRDEHSLYLAIAQRAWGVAYRLAGKLGEAQALLDQALESFTSMDARWQAGRTFYELGELAGSRGDPDGAKGNFEKALAAFEAIAAHPDVERTRRALAGSGWDRPAQGIASLN